MKLNKELLLRAADAIEANPQHFDMRSWVGVSEYGTTGCIVGWAIFLHKKRKNFSLFALNYNRNDNFLPPRLMPILGIESDELFCVLACWSEWKNKWMQSKYTDAGTGTEKAKIAADYVRWFVANYDRLDGEI